MISLCLILQMWKDSLSKALHCASKQKSKYENKYNPVIFVHIQSVYISNRKWKLHIVKLHFLWWFSPKKKGNQIHEYLWIITINLFDWLQLLAEANLMWEAWLHTARISTGLDTPVSKYHTVFSINAQWLCNWIKPKLPKRHKWKLEEDLYNQNHFIITLSLAM